MCHTIVGRTKFGYIKDIDMLVGLKKITIYRGSMSAYHMQYKYNYKLVKLAGCIARIDIDLSKQNILIFIPIIDENLEKQIWKRKTLEFTAGAHISPLLSEFANHENLFAVGFRTDDIIFYDGDDVSVKRFYLLNEKYVRKLKIYNKLKEKLIDEIKLIKQIL